MATTTTELNGFPLPVWVSLCASSHDEQWDWLQFDSPWAVPARYMLDRLRYRGGDGMFVSAVMALLLGVSPYIISGRQLSAATTWLEMHQEVP